MYVWRLNMCAIAVNCFADYANDGRDIETTNNCTNNRRVHLTRLMQGHNRVPWEASFATRYFLQSAISGAPPPPLTERKLLQCYKNWKDGNIQTRSDQIQKDIDDSDLLAASTVYAPRPRAN
jgi:hypothetical protein